MKNQKFRIESGLSVGEVGAACGFENNCSFSRAFRARSGRPLSIHRLPGAVRQALQMPRTGIAKRYGDELRNVIVRRQAPARPESLRWVQPSGLHRDFTTGIDSPRSSRYAWNSTMEKNPVVRPAIGTGLLLLVPLVLSILDRHRPEGDGWHWRPLDFIVMGTLIFGAGCAYELIARRLGSRTHRMVLGFLVLFVASAIWIELAVDGISQLVGHLVH